MEIVEEECSICFENYLSDENPKVVLPCCSNDCCRNCLVTNATSRKTVVCMFCQEDIPWKIAQEYQLVPDWKSYKSASKLWKSMKRYEKEFEFVMKQVSQTTNFIQTEIPKSLLRLLTSVLYNYFNKTTDKKKYISSNTKMIRDMIKSIQKSYPDLFVNDMKNITPKLPLAHDFDQLNCIYELYSGVSEIYRDADHVSLSPDDIVRDIDSVMEDMVLNFFDLVSSRSNKILFGYTNYLHDNLEMIHDTFSTSEKILERLKDSARRSYHVMNYFDAFKDFLYPFILRMAIVRDADMDDGPFKKLIQRFTDTYIEFYPRNFGTEKIVRKITSTDEYNRTESCLFFICPGCNLTEIPHDMNTMTKYFCSRCDKDFCRKCSSVIKDQYHGCEQKDIDDLRNILFVMCPRCDAKICKEHGCNQMFCVNCDFKFDYESLREIKDNEFYHNEHHDQIKKRKREKNGLVTSSEDSPEGSPETSPEDSPKIDSSIFGNDPDINCSSIEDDTISMIYQNLHTLIFQLRFFVNPIDIQENYPSAEYFDQFRTSEKYAHYRNKINEIVADVRNIIARFIRFLDFFQRDLNTKTPEMIIKSLLRESFRNREILFFFEYKNNLRIIDAPEISGYVESIYKENKVEEIDDSVEISTKFEIFMKSILKNRMITDNFKKILNMNFRLISEMTLSTIPEIMNNLNNMIFVFGFVEADIIRSVVSEIISDMTNKYEKTLYHVFDSLNYHEKNIIIEEYKNDRRKFYEESGEFSRRLFQIVGNLEKVASKTDDYRENI